MKKTDLRLHAYLDGELTPPERESFEKALSTDQALQQECETLQALSDELAALPKPEPIPAEPVWQHVQRELRLSSEPRSRPAIKWAWAPAAVAAMVWGALTLLPFSSSPFPTSVIVEQVEVHADATVPLVYTDQDSGWTVVWLSTPNSQEEYAPL